MTLYLHEEEIRRQSLEQGKIESKIEDIKELLNELGSIPAEVLNKITAETDLDILRKWIKLAAKSDSIEEFMNNM